MICPTKNYPYISDLTAVMADFIQDITDGQTQVQKKLEEEKDFAMYYLYVADLLTYSLDRYGHKWYILNRANDTCKNRRFLTVIGEAVLQYHRRHAEELGEEVANTLMPLHGNYIDEEAISDCLLDVARRFFKGDNFVKEFFVFCSFLVELALYCTDIGQFEQLTMIVDGVIYVYELFLKRRFMAFGGWNVLHRYAVHYTLYEMEPEVNIQS